MSKNVNDIDYVVEVLLEADDMTDTVVARKYDITTATIRNYRKRMDIDRDLARAYFLAKKQIFSSVVTRISRTQSKMLEKLEALIDSCDDISRVSAAYKIVADSFLAQSIMSGVSEGKDDVKHHHQSPHAESAKRATREASERSPKFIADAAKLTQ